ncbi:MAG: enolase C-terminal domain-like protein [Inquilinaceae bacterium]
MKITAVKPYLAGRYLYVEIETDAGITGVGESGAWGHLEASRSAIEKFGTYLVGKDPGPIEHHWAVMYRFGHFKGAAIGGAISAIDIALWDIKGQTLGVPIHTLLGGPVRSRARVYAHVKAGTAAEMVTRCQELKAQGFTAIGHLNPFLDEDRSQPYGKGHARKIADAVALVGKLREVLGSDIDLCIEIHRRLNPAEAIAFGREIAPYRPMFYEDPIAPTSVHAMASVAGAIAVPLATGERFSSLFEFQAHIAARALTYARVSVCLCGGLTGARKIAALAEAHDVQVIPHNPLSPVSLHACLQLAAAVPNFAIQEYPTVGSDLEDGSTRCGNTHRLRGTEFVKTGSPVTDGYIAIPTEPGLGVSLTDRARNDPAPIARDVYMRPHADGFVVDQ